MPLAIGCDELKPGMRLAEAIVFKGMLMLPAAKVLTASDIHALGRRLPWMSVRVFDPILDELAEFQDDSQDRIVADTAANLIGQHMAEVHKRLSVQTSIGGSGIDFSQARKAVVGVIKYLQDNPVSSALLTRCLDASDHLAVHAGNVFYLSIVLGSALLGYLLKERKRQTAAHLDPDKLQDLTPLGLGAMFADIGMAPLALLFGVEELLSDSQRSLVYGHSRSGADLLPDRFPSLARIVVRTHHENFAGSGYPGQIGGVALHVFTRVVRIADAFDSATSNTFSEAMSPIRALWEMSAGPFGKCYDPVMMTVFRGVIQPFPIGAKLRLTDGRQAVVVRHNQEDPFDPTVVVAFDQKGRRLRELEQPAPLTQSGLTIKSFENEDLSYLYGSREGTARPPAKFHTLFEASYP